MNVCYIVSASEMSDSFPETDGTDLIIAADGGYKHLQKLNVEPDIIIGDFDSSEEPSVNNKIKHPTVKDDTDTMLAVKYGFEKGYSEFKIYGGLGGKRTDHTIANIQTLAYIALNGGTGHLIGSGECFTLIKDREITIELNENSYISIFAYGGKAEGVSIKGTKYDVSEIELTPFFPLGVSNAAKDNCVEIEVKKGYLLIKYDAIL